LIRLVRDARVHVGLLAVQVMFGTLPLAGQVAMAHITPVGLATLRIAEAALVLGLAASRRLASIRRGDLPWLALFAGLGVVGNQVLFLTGLSRTTQINASILITSIPVFAVAFALLLRRERASARRLAGVCVGLAGALLLSRVERFDLSDARVTGNVMILVNAAFWSLHLVLARRMLQRVDPLVVSAWMFIIGAAVMVPLGAGQVVSAIGSASWIEWAAAGWAVAVPTILAYLVNMWALGRIEASSVAIYAYLQPVVAGLLAWLVAGEGLTVRGGISAILVFAGVALVHGRARRSEL
jgi:drug/metabolite transporter (DMT)-like permease